MDTHFLGKTIFEKCLGENGQILPIFHGIKDGRFTDLFIGPDARIIFRSADLSRILFFGTRLINIEFTDIVWAQTKDILCFDRIALFDELDLRKAIEETKTSKEKIDLAKNFSHVEILYRDIKRAYEEDKNHEFAGEFHYGEKEMKRKNPSTNIVLRFFLFLYWAISGYGERFLRPLFWLALIFIVSTVGHMFLGLSASTTETLHPTNVQDWLRITLFSLQVITLQNPTK